MLSVTFLESLRKVGFLDQLFGVHRNQLCSSVVNDSNQVHGIGLTLKDDIGLIVKLTFKDDLLVVLVDVDFDRFFFFDVFGSNVGVLLSDISVEV